VLSTHFNRSVAGFRSSNLSIARNNRSNNAAADALGVFRVAINWTDIAFVPDAELAEETAIAWKWLIPESWKIVLSSMFGGVFLEKKSGGVFWLECGTALVERVADNAADFHAYLKSERDNKWAEQVEEWFLIGLVQRLHDAGKTPGPGQCYGLTILPVFEGGRYDVENAFVLSAREWLTVTASLHHQILGIPDGAQVKIKVGE
jgi:hypothetical protein